MKRSLSDFIRNAPLPEREEVFGRALKRASEMQAETIAMTEEQCWCARCDRESGAVLRWRMNLCPECGNKRCPKSSDHRNDCTGSNEPGQKGSCYE